MPEAAYSHSKIIMCRVFYANPPKRRQHVEIEENTRKRAQIQETGVISKRWENSIHKSPNTVHRYIRHSEAWMDTQVTEALEGASGWQ